MNKTILLLSVMTATAFAMYNKNDVLEIQRLDGYKDSLGVEYIVTDKGTFKDQSGTIRRTSNGYSYNVIVKGVSIPALGVKKQVLGAERVNKTVYVENESAHKKIFQVASKRLGVEDFQDIVETIIK